MSRNRLDRSAYTVGWVTTLHCELVASRALLDEEHEGLSFGPQDPNTYILGRMGVHNIVIVGAGQGQSGIVPATQTVTHMLRTFPNIRFGLLVGIGGGAPRAPDLENEYNDIRLGDVVVSCLDENDGGIVHYDKGKVKDDGFHIASHVSKPPDFLLKKAQVLRTDHDLGMGEMEEYISRAQELGTRRRALKAYRFPGRAHDKLFKAHILHVGGGNCSKCDSHALEKRLDRDEPSIHYGLIASGSRGISNYADGHKNDKWQPYAAVTAAAYAKDLLRIVFVDDVETAPSLITVTSNFVESLASIEGSVSSIKTTFDESKKVTALNSLPPSDSGDEQKAHGERQTEGRGIDSWPRENSLSMEEMQICALVQAKRA